MSRLTVIGVLLVLGCCASTPAMRTRSVDEVADARALLIEDHYTLAPNGARVHRVLHKTEVLSDYAIGALGDPRLVHDSAGQTLKVLRADTTMRDGTKVSIKPNSITETTPDVMASAPAYADLRETVVTHVGMEVGCTNELEYELRSAASERPLWDEQPLHLPFPTDRRVISVTLPAGAELRWRCLGCEVTPKEEAVASGGKRYSFVWEKLPALNINEAGRHPHAPVFGQPRLVFSSAASWKALNDDLAGRFSAAAQPDETIKARAAELTERLVTDEERALALWRFVAKRVQTVDWSLDQLGHAPSAAATVLERSYGHAMDKAALLAALLDAAGMTAVPALISRDALLARKVPTLAPFDDVWLILDLDGELRWLSPHAARGGGLDRLEGRWALPLIDRSQKRMPFLIAKTPYAMGEPVPIQTGKRGLDRNRSLVVADLSPAPGGEVKATFDVTLTGTYNPYVETSPEDGAGKVARGLLGSMGAGGWKLDCEGCASQVKTFSADRAGFGYSAAGQSAGAERVMELALPWAPRSQLLNLDLHRGARQTAMALEARGEERAVIKLRVPKGYQLSSKLPVGEVKNAVGSLVTTSAREGDEITIERALRIEQRVIKPQDYPALRALAEELWRADARTLLFVKQ